MTTTLDYRPFAPDLIADPYPAYARLRDEAPVHHVPDEDLWVVSRYDDVLAVLRDPATFSSAAGMGRLMQGTIGPGRRAMEGDASSLLGIDPGTLRVLVATDPPDHTRLRRLVGNAFTPRMIARLEDRVRSISESLLDDLLAAAESGPIDLIARFAWPLPVIVIAEVLGVPSERRAEFRQWSADMVGGLTGAWERESVQASALAMFEYFTEVVAERTATPGDDLISSLLSHGAAGDDPLDPMEIMMFCVLLLIAGNETTTNLIGNGVAAFWEHPEQARRLTQEPQLLGSAVEEALRYDAPVQALFRTTTRPTTLADTALPADANIMVSFGSANRDERHYGDDAATFRVDRNPVDHLAFGSGIHLCLGAHLARLEARVAGEVLLERIGALEPADGAERTDGFLLRGFRQLPVAVRPR